MSPKVQIRALTKTISVMQRQRMQMIKAFQNAFRVLEGRFNATAEAVRILGDGNPEILKLLQIQPEEGANEAGSGDEKPRILSLPGARDDAGTEGHAESSEDKASSQALGSSSIDR